LSKNWLRSTKSTCRQASPCISRICSAEQVQLQPR
jgi:hypothetical protein